MIRKLAFFVVSTALMLQLTSLPAWSQRDLKVYFAGLHSHTSYSDGKLLPADAHKYARDVAKLDIFCLTDHLESVDDNEWQDTQEVASKFNEDGKFVSFRGLEWTKGWGHCNIFDPDTRHWPRDGAAFYKAAADAGVVCKFNHAGGWNDEKKPLFDRFAYSPVGDKAMQLMEVRHVAEERAFIRALDQGWHIAPEGSDDTHSPNWGNCGRWTGILAPALTKKDILDALKARHCYSTLDRNCRLLFETNGATMGDIIEEPVKEVAVTVAVDDADDGDNIAKIELFQDGKVIQTDEPNATSHRWETTVDAKPGNHYYFSKITQADGNLLWSAPIWITVAKKFQPQVLKAVGGE